MRTRTLWWTAAALILLSETFVFLRTIPEKRRWAKAPVLDLALPTAETTPASGRDVFVEQPERLGGAVQQLAYADARCGTFFPAMSDNSGGARLEFFYFEYDAGNSRFVHDVFGHVPEVCMSASGAVLKATHPSRSIEIAGRSHEVLVLEFVSPLSSQPMWVFRFTWLPEGVPYHPYDTSYLMREAKFLIGLLGKPKPPARVLLAGAIGYDDLESAWAEYERMLVSRLRMASPR